MNLPLKTSRWLRLAALALAALAGCSSDESGEGHATNLTPFGFLAGGYQVEVSPTEATCEGQVYFPQEAWTVTNYLASVAVMPVPVASSGPLVMDGGSHQDAGPPQAIPQSFSGVMGATLHWRASLQEYATTEQGCLDRTTTVLELQFTPDAHFTGTRSIFHESAGGADCTTDCRLQFEMTGEKRAE